MDAKQLGNFLLAVLKHPVTYETLALLIKQGKKVAKIK